MRQRKYNLPAHVCWDVTCDLYHMSCIINKVRYSNKYKTVKEAMERVAEIYQKTGKWDIKKAQEYLNSYSKYESLDNKGIKSVSSKAKTEEKFDFITSSETLSAIFNVLKDKPIPYKDMQYNNENNTFEVSISDRYLNIIGIVKGTNVEARFYVYNTGTYNDWNERARNVYTKEEFCQLLERIDKDYNWSNIFTDIINPQPKVIVTPKVATVKGKYMGHITHKYDTIRPKDKFYFDGKWHLLLTNLLYKSQYILREDGEVFSYKPETGEMKRKVQFFSESGGVKNRARREAGKSGGSVYKTVGLWNSQFLTHKLLSKYFTQDDEVRYCKSTGGKDQIILKKKKVSSDFYKGNMPVGYNRRCYKAN